MSPIYCSKIFQAKNNNKTLITTEFFLIHKPIKSNVWFAIKDCIIIRYILLTYIHRSTAVKQPSIDVKQTQFLHPVHSPCKDDYRRSQPYFLCSFDELYSRVWGDLCFCLMSSGFLLHNHHVDVKITQPCFPSYTSNHDKSVFTHCKQLAFRYLKCFAREWFTSDRGNIDTIILYLLKDCSKNNSSAFIQLDYFINELQSLHETELYSYSFFKIFWYQNTLHCYVAKINSESVCFKCSKEGQPAVPHV